MPAAACDAEAYRDFWRYRLSPRKRRANSKLQRSESVAVSAHRQSRGGNASRSRHSCRRLRISRRCLPGRQSRLRGQSLWLWLGRVECRFLRAGGAALCGRALGTGARQSRGLHTRRRRLVPLSRSRAAIGDVPRYLRHLSSPKWARWVSLSSTWCQGQRIRRRAPPMHDRDLARSARCRGRESAQRGVAGHASPARRDPCRREPTSRTTSTAWCRKRPSPPISRPVCACTCRATSTSFRPIRSRHALPGAAGCRHRRRQSRQADQDESHRRRCQRPHHRVGRGLYGFAYMVWDRRGTAWSGTLYDTGGKAIERCKLSGRSLSC